MSKSTRFTKDQLDKMGLVETSPGVFGPKKRTVNLKEVYNEISKKKMPLDILSPEDFMIGVDPASDEPSHSAVVKRWADGTVESVHFDGLPRPDLIEEMRQISKYYNTSIIHESIRITVLGDPTPQQRHRHHQVKGADFVTTYDPSSKKKKEFLKACLPYKPDRPHEQPLRVDMVFYFSRPKSHYRSGKYAHILKDTAPTLHVSRPDADNCAKFVKDSLNKTFWKDDSFVCDMNVKKRYDENPRTEITITPL